MNLAIRPLQGAVSVAALLMLLALPVRAQSIFINEIHYDNIGADVDEAIEVAGPAGTDLTGYSVLLYNGGTGGNHGKRYDIISLSGVLPDQQGGFGTLAFYRAGIQNGDPDGLALVAPDNSVIQFLSYGGTFTAADGLAAGMTSTDIGVKEPGTTPIGYSLQLVGSGSRYEDFAWEAPKQNTFGDINDGQTFAAASDGCQDPLTAPSYAGGYVTNSAGTRAFIEVSVPEGGMFFEFYSTSNLAVGNPEADTESGTALTGFDRSGDSFLFTPGSPTSVFFPISTISSSTRVTFFLAVTDICGRTVDVDPEFALASAGEHLAGTSLVAYPNPAAGPATIRFSMEQAGPARVTVYDVLGREMAVVANADFGAGDQSVSLDASSLSSGLYVIRLEAGGRVLTQTFTVAR